MENEQISQKVKIVAYLIGEKIQMAELLATLTGVIYSSTSTEIFIHIEGNSYVYIQNYGEISFANCSETIINEYIAMVLPFVTNRMVLPKQYKEDFVIEVDSSHHINFRYTSIQVPEINGDVIKIVMLNVSQSVVLDYFTDLSLGLLRNTSQFTLELELKGKLGIAKKELMRFIGKALNTQNRIIDNLYFIDAPDTVWENEYLAKINTGLSRTFDLKTRFREVEYTLKIIDNNLRTFAQLVQHRDSNKLEWIIIFLILFEILNIIFEKLL